MSRRRLSTFNTDSLNGDRKEPVKTAAKLLSKQLLISGYNTNTRRGSQVYQDWQENSKMGAQAYIDEISNSDSERMGKKSISCNQSITAQLLLPEPNHSRSKSLVLDFKQINDAYNSDIKLFERSTRLSAKRKSYFNEMFNLSNSSAVSTKQKATLQTVVDTFAMGKKKKINLIEKLRSYRSFIQSKKKSTKSDTSDQGKEMTYYHDYKYDADCRSYVEKKEEIDDDELEYFLTNSCLRARRNCICEEIDRQYNDRQLIEFMEFVLREDYVYSFLF
jgi:hypothetical protein